MGGRQGDGVEIRGKSIRIRFMYQGKRYQLLLKTGDEPMKPTAANLKYARRLIDEIRAKIAAEAFVIGEYFPELGDGAATTLGGQLDRWLGAQRIETSTKKGYESAIRFWKTATYRTDLPEAPFGDVPLRQVKPSHILTVMAQRVDLSGKTINNYLSVLRDALSLAVADRILQDNPAKNVSSVKAQAPLPDPFDGTERDRIVAEFQSRHSGQVANLVQTWMWTGMRTSEIFGLKWTNVDLTKGEILVTEVLVRGEAKDRTKTSVARTVKLNSRALEAIKAQKAHTYLAGDFVFLDPRYDTPWTDERAFRRSFWTPLLKRLGIRYRRPYQMRHTYATTMLMAGMTPAFCAKQLGHSTEMFFRKYSKWINGQADEREMAQLENNLSQETNVRKIAG